MIRQLTNVEAVVDTVAKTLMPDKAVWLVVTTLRRPSVAPIMGQDRVPSLFTNTAKEIAEERHRFMAQFFNRLEAEVKGEL